jgi:hypothetical protein
MSLKDKLEIGLKPDAPYRPDNLPDFQQDDPACQDGATPGESARLRHERDKCDDAGDSRSRNMRGGAPPKGGTVVARRHGRRAVKSKVRSQKSEVRGRR